MQRKIQQEIKRLADLLIGSRMEPGMKRRVAGQTVDLELCQCQGCVMGLLLSALQRFLTPELVGRVATAVGIDPKLAQGAASAAIPAVMSGLSQVAGTSNGADRLANAMDRAPPGMLDNLANRLTNPGEMIERGQSLMGSLLGNGATTALTSSLARYVGTGEGSTRSLLGLLMPIVLGVLGRQQQTVGGDGAGLARQLRSESGDFRAAMPSGLSSLLDSSGFFNRLGMVEQPTGATAGTTGPRETTREREPASRPAGRRVEVSSAPDYSWAYWALPLTALLAGLLGYLLGGGREERDMTTAMRGGDVTTAMPMRSYMRQTIVSETGEPLGTIQDMIVMPDGRVAAVVGVEQALGMGEKRVAVPMTDITTTTRDGGMQLVLKGSRDDIANAPTVGPDVGTRTTPGGTTTTPGTTQTPPGAQQPSPPQTTPTPGTPGTPQ